jgi:hypothetical protein
LEYLTGLTTKHTKAGTTQDAVTVDVVSLDSVDGPEEYNGMRVFQGVLIGTLKRAAKYNETHPDGDPSTGRPRMILGRLGRGEDKTGRLTPNLYNTDADKRAWILEVPSEEDKQAARDFLAKKPVDDPFSI